MISIIIPVYNEEKILRQRSELFNKLGGKAELIFVDGESNDESAEIASKYGKLVKSNRGRALQMNQGFREARGDTLLFLHADTFFDPESLSNIEKTIVQGYIGGCLTQFIDRKGAAFRAIELFGNIRARMTKVFYGDQAIFVKKEMFSAIGGFPEVPIMEDVLFSKKMRRKGKTKILEDKVTVSGRRWEKRGVMNTVLLYSFLNILFYMKVPLNRIKKYYDDLR
jgi:rSAM/selenodomain-associated transferase 2